MDGFRKLRLCFEERKLLKRFLNIGLSSIFDYSYESLSLRKDFFILGGSYKESEKN